MRAVERFEAIATQERFQGWPLVGEYRFCAKIPFFGQTLEYQLLTGNGVENYFSILRHFGWVVCFGVTTDEQVITLAQWKPGINAVEWGFPPGGIGRVPPRITGEEILTKTKEFYLRETGYGGGSWRYLGHVMIDSGKYRGASPDDHGFPAHLFLATQLERQGEARKPNPNEIMETILVPLSEFREVIYSGFFKETSAVPCALLALIELGLLAWKM